LAIFENKTYLCKCLGLTECCVPRNPKYPSAREVELLEEYKKANKKLPKCNEVMPS